MPTATHYSPDDRTIRQAATLEFRERHAQHTRNEHYYGGAHKPQLLDPADNLVLNLCKQAIDRTIAFLVPSFPTIQLLPNTDETWLRLGWQQGGVDPAVLLKQWVLIGALDGHSFIKIIDTPSPRLVLLDGRQMIKFVAADDLEQVLWYELQWDQGRERFRQDIVNEDGRWRFREFKMRGSRWELLDEIVWNYPLSPVVDVQHLPNPNAIYGGHELEHAALNDNINKIASDINRILRFHAYPRTIGTGFEASAIQPTGIDDFWSIANDNARVFNLEMQSDLAASMAFMRELTDTFFRESRVHIDKKTGPRTAYETRLDYMDMIAKNHTLRAQYGTGIVEVSRRLLMIGGRAWETVGMLLEWENPLPADKLAEVAYVKQLIELGVLSKPTAAAMVGLDYAAEVERMTS